MKGIGIDIVDIARFKKIRNLDRFLEIVFSPREIVESKSRKDKFAYISSRFAAKEAVIKAMPIHVSPKDFEVGKDGLKPKVIFLNKKLRLGKFKILLSLSHCDDYSAAVALVE